ncbi:MAG TPA: GNAT family N-acetyltransferase [Nitrososphaerales archaeon]|nr:GNAT family N-acetyltransferase [Nitrososphaerales archaeon]
MHSFKLSQAKTGDIDTLVAHRQMMWLDIHPELGKQVEDTERLTRRWIRKQLSRKRLVGFIVRTEEGDVAGSGCVWIREEQPRPTNPRLEVPYLMSMFTEKEYRRMGVATLVVQAALQWAKERGFERVVLHASNDGRPVYEGLGFQQSSEMRIRL